MIEWTVLGSGTHVASDRRNSPGHLAIVDGTHLLVDCGAGSFHGLKRAGSAPGLVEACLVTHVHPDHVSDLVPLLFHLRNGVKEEGEEKALPLFGPPGLARFVQALREVHAPFLEAERFELVVREREAGTAIIGRAEIRWVPVAHGIASVAFSITAGEGGRAVYSGDTGYSVELVRLARGADLLVIEATLPNEKTSPFHLNPAGAARIAAEAEVKEMVLVHLDPIADRGDVVAACGDLFPGRIVLGEDRLSLRVGPGSAP